MNGRIVLAVRTINPLLLALLSSTAAGQCTPAWDTAFAGNVNDLAFRSVVFDEDAAGPQREALYACGTFLTAGAIPARRVARWNGESWSALGSGLGSSSQFGGAVQVLQVFDEDGPGPMLPSLFAGGSFGAGDNNAPASFAKWTGSAWVSVGGGVVGSINAMTVWDQDGSGPLNPVLVIGGSITSAGGQPTQAMAAWNGTSWNVFGGGLAPSSIHALAAFDEDGAGPNPPKLIGGFFDLIDESVVLRWSGDSWEPMGAGLTCSIFDARCHALIVRQSGGKPQLYAAGRFTNSGSTSIRNIARWSSGSWVDVGLNVSPTFSDIWDLAWLDDTLSGQPALFAVGSGVFTGDAAIARFNGTQWTSVAAPELKGTALGLSTWDADGPGPARSSLYITGDFTLNNAPARIARWGCPTCYANCDASSVNPVLTANDFQCFLNRFAAGSDYANCDQSTLNPVLTANDFQCFLNTYAAGCP